MATSYVINFTDPTKLPFTVQPGQVDGPGEVQAHTSLKMHGQGTVTYGENVNENFIKLLEHFANPTPPPFPTEGQMWYDSDATLIKFFDGVRWIHVGKPFNGCPAPTDPDSGQLWYDECLLEPPTVRVWDGTTLQWNSVGFRYLLRQGDAATDHANFMTGNLQMGPDDLNKHRILHVADPVGPADAVPFNFADVRYVNIPGDTMTGRLDITGTTAPTGLGISRLTAPTLRIANTTPVGNGTTIHPGIWLVNPDNDPAKGAPPGPNTIYGYASWAFKDGSLFCVDGYTVDGDMSTAGTTNLFCVQQDGKINAPFGTPTASTHLTTKQYVDTADANLQTQVNAITSNIANNFYDKPTSDARFVKKAGDTMAGDLSFASAFRITNLPTPTLFGHAVPFGFADSRYVNVPGDTMTGALILSTTGDPGADGAAVSRKFVRDKFSEVGPVVAKNGDIQVADTVISIYAGGAYRQVFPALYTA